MSGNGWVGPSSRWSHSTSTPSRYDGSTTHYVGVGFGGGGRHTHLTVMAKRVGVRTRMVMVGHRTEVRG